MEKIISIREILLYLKEKGFECEFYGDGRQFVNGFSSIFHYREGTVTWLKNKDNAVLLDKKRVRLLISQTYYDSAENLIVSQRSKDIFFGIIDYYYGNEEPRAGVGQNTVIGKNVELGHDVIIGNNCTILGDITIGDETIIEDNVVIKNRVSIGKKCHIQSLCEIGEDGFGWIELSENKKKMIKHYGGVIIGDDVFIGAHTNVNRGVIDDTIIGDGVKIAESCHIGHNSVIERNVIFICSHCYGSVYIGENAYIVGSIIKNQCSIGKDTMIGMGSVVTKSISENKIAVGVPAKVIRDRFEI